MQASIVRMPFSAYVGSVAIRLVVKEPAEAREALREIEKVGGPGIGCVWLYDVPWTEPWWEEALASIQEGMTYRRDCVGVLDLADMHWVPGDIHWVIDATALYQVSKGNGSMGVEKALEHVGSFPSCQDVIVRVEAGENIASSQLDVLGRHLQPENPGQLLVDAGDYGRHLPVIARTETRWVVVPS